jgi:RNA-binding protein
MITTKQRSNLKSLAHKLTPDVLIGKEGISQNLIDQIETVLENKELIKVKVLSNSSVKAKSIINELAEKLNAEPVLAVGGVMVLYRFSNKEGIQHIQLD